ncbi:unnamed protein product [Dracunculus medinensis]|uniref:Tr-type G domain-containing protein n=1 Tax=Dracunculus medinensis TaxID=318479 RepID=A0A3P7Q7K0_DRAME|nr:unnamed protein product [Dracunculus medinensis]
MKIVSIFNMKPQLVTRPKALPPREKCHKRSPIITIMGHVDHGKTTLLDCLRKSRIVESEFGGITQHIGAFTLNDCDTQMTFLDTPGHAAFAKMRQRGAQVTDIVVLVVAAEEGVKDQTVQSIKFAKEAGVPIIVAINKCDKPNANPLRAKQSLIEHGVVVEDFDGDILSVEISALLGKNIDSLKQAILLLAEDLDLFSTSEGRIEGTIIESTMVQGLGGVCTMIVQRGTLRKNSILVAGTSWCKVRTMTDEFNKTVDEAGPSIPVRVSGWRNELVSPGEVVIEAESVDHARKVTQCRIAKNKAAKRDEELKAIEKQREEDRMNYLLNRKALYNRGIRHGSVNRMIVHKEHRFTKEMVDDGHPKLKIMIFSDVDGTLEVLLNVIDSYSSPEVDLQLVDFGVGAPNENDLEIASELNAVVYCFNITVPKAITMLAERLHIRILSFNVIYHLVNNLKQLLNDRVPLKKEFKLVGVGEVLRMFLVPLFNDNKQPIAGIRIIWGIFDKSCKYRIKRKNKLICESHAISMKCENEVIKSAKENQEVGLAFNDYTLRFKKHDSVEAYQEICAKVTISWNPPGF